MTNPEERYLTETYVGRVQSPARPIQKVGRRADAGHDHRVLALLDVVHVFQRLVEVQVLDGRSDLDLEPDLKHLEVAPLGPKPLALVRGSRRGRSVAARA